MKFHDQIFRDFGSKVAPHMGSVDDLKTVQENLGHHTVPFTLDVYGHVTERMRRQSAHRMEQLIQAVSIS